MIFLGKSGDFYRKINYMIFTRTPDDFRVKIFRSSGDFQKALEMNSSISREKKSLLLLTSLFGCRVVKGCFQ